MIRGPIAVVWGEYEFFVNGQRNHCGVDSVEQGIPHARSRRRDRLARILPTVAQ